MFHVTSSLQKFPYRKLAAETKMIFSVLLSARVYPTILRSLLGIIYATKTFVGNAINSASNVQLDAGNIS